MFSFFLRSLQPNFSALIHAKAARANACRTSLVYCGQVRCSHTPSNLQLNVPGPGEITMNKPVLDAQTLQNLAEGDRAVISGFQGTIQACSDVHPRVPACLMATHMAIADCIESEDFFHVFILVFSMTWMLYIETFGTYILSIVVCQVSHISFFAFGTLLKEDTEFFDRGEDVASWLWL